VAYSPSGAQLASGSRDKTVRLWDAASGQLLSTLSGHQDLVRSVAYSPSGAQLASGSKDQTVRLWDATSGQCLAVISDFHGGVSSVAWKTTHKGDDGDYLVTGSSDKSVRVWRVIQNGDQCQVRLCWSSGNEALTLTDASIQNVQGLNPMNQQLLKQRGAKGEPSSQTQTAQSSQPQTSNLISRLFRPLESFAASAWGSSASSATPSGDPRPPSQATSTPLGPGQWA